ncbi:MAG: diguanylate cyclase [Gammaproteobacteria bacterium]|nr:diguanylate cyclase [Gammaproteobacteria bacterium]
MKLRVVFVLVCFCLISTFFYQFIQKSKERASQNLANQTLESTNAAYKAIVETYNVASERHFLSLMRNKQVLNILKKFKTENSDEQEILRGELYRLLYEEYQILKQFNVRQFHFHTHDGKSLLRFHSPSLNGDSLFNIRQSIRIANLNKKKVTGFEGGRVYPGYRYVFPIIYDNEHLGSVEFSISFEGIEKKLKTILPFYAHQLILEKEISYSKVFKQHKVYFITSEFDDLHFIEHPQISKITNEIQNDSLVSQLTQIIKNNPEYENFLHNKKNQSIPIIYNNSAYVVNFLNIYNIENKLAGHIVSFGELDDLLKINENYNKTMFMGLIVLVILLFLVIFIIFQINKTQSQKQEMLNKLQKFIDIQDSIVILTNGSKLNFANQKFFDFFGYENLELFLEDYTCICHRFIDNDNFFHLGNVLEEQKHWVESLLNLPGRQRIVSMLDKSSVPYAFTVTINHYNSNSYVINFSDITDNMLEKLQLQKQTIHDPLTQAYNRVYYNNSIQRLIELNHQRNKKTGVIFFDIDYFKEINDTCGHEAGDTILKNLVNLVSKQIRETDQLIRWGGEEFIIITSTDSLKDVAKQAEYIRAMIEHHNFSTVKKLSCSFGVSIYEQGNDIHKVIKQADKKLYEAKNSGRNKVAM